ncbi:ISAs1 family transposase [Thorsellia anophelis]|uniref:DDE_Tnp_1-associated n=1 Tax=Thorsellia anophelis DSM 18579 TaxID=1123402 RepID=A0A1I0G4Q2_9GAMM|nr:ISAs1 family transposase [Thorsellia anophelis]SET65576.1 DDE_Tnp_1-associated [Thorsellia anophelis DSM 18579]
MKLIKILDTLEENRKKTNQKYPVKEIAFLVLAGLICGYSSWTSITEFGEYNLKWLRKFMPYKQGIPTRHNVARIIRMIKPESLNNLLITWANAYSKKSDVAHSDEEINRIRSVFAIDGKEIKGVKARTGEVLNAVTVFDVDNGISFSTEMGAINVKRPVRFFYCYLHHCL